MNTRATIIATVMALVIATASATRIKPIDVNATATFNGYFVLALQKCDGDSPWTIHGLWPQYSENRWPSYCGGGSFDRSQVSSLWSEIMQDWPTCSWSGNSEESFLSHEWQKHGSCAGMSQMDYFQTTLSIYNAGAWRSQCSDASTSCKVSYNGNALFAALKALKK